MSDIEVDITAGGSNKAIIEGKTSVPFRTFVTLILQRKVQMLFKDSQNEPVIIGSELLTKLASAPGDQQEDRGKLVLVTFACGMVGGIFLSSLVLLGLLLSKIRVTSQSVMIVLGVIAVLGAIVVVMQRTQKKPTFKQKLYDAMEKMTDSVSG
jgi:F0F1-type ATP synthase assembly protein I